MNKSRIMLPDYLQIKKILDTAIGLIAGIILLPVLFLIGLCIVIEDGWPVLFKQRRVGRYQSCFFIYKFRTMKREAPHDCPTHLLRDPDRYLTKTGKFLRQYSLDELPQLINIVRGEMAIVGPRPALWNQFDLIREREKHHANDIRPGLTGWAQIHGRDTLDIQTKAAFDGYYKSHLSLLLDIQCIFETLTAVWRREGYMEGGTGACVNHAKEKEKLMICTNHSYMFYQFHRELLLRLSENCQLILCTPYTGRIREFKKMGVRCHKTDIDRRGCHPFRDFCLIMHYWRIFRREKPDRVMTYSIKPNIYAGIICRMMKIPYCIQIQGLGTSFEKNILAAWVTFLYRFALEKADVVFFENVANADTLLRKRLIASDQVKILPGAGVNLERYPYTPLPKGREAIRFLYLGRLMKEKGIDELLSAIVCLHKKYGHRVVLDIVGFYEEAYEKKIQKLCRKKIVVFHGFQKNPVPFYQNADCVVLPSYHEGMSNVLLEAAATGRPVIASDIPGCREVVRDRISGYLCLPENTHSLYEKMDQLMQLDETARESMGKAGRAHMEKYFDRNRVVNETIVTLRAVKGKK